MVLDADRIRLVDESRSDLPFPQYEVVDVSSTESNAEWTQTSQELWQEWSKRKDTEDALLDAIQTIPVSTFAARSCIQYLTQLLLRIPTEGKRHYSVL